MANDCTNEDIGRELGLSHSAVSRMRAGTRTGSLDTLIKIAEVTAFSLEDVVTAAIAARRGDKSRWTEIMDALCGDKIDA